jgi:hypothetical protein
MRTLARRVVVVALFAAAPFAVSLPSEPVALAADASSSPASDDIALTGGQASALDQKLKDTTDWASDEGKRESAKWAIEGVESGIQRIKSKDPKWDVSAWEKLVKTARARLAKAESGVAAKDAADKANEDGYRDYNAKITAVRDGFDLLATLDTKPASVEIFSKNQVVGNMAKAIAGVASLDEACKANHYEKLSAPPSYSYLPPAAQACKVAAKWKTLGKKFMDLQVKGGVPKEIAYLEGVIAAAKRGDAIEGNDHNGLMNPDKRIESFRKDYDDAAKLLGVTVDATAFEPIRTVAGGYAAAVKEATKTSRFDPKATQPEQGAAARSRASTRRAASCLPARS